MAEIVDSAPADLATPKRILDIILALLALTSFTPLFVIVAVAIKLDSCGSVFFRRPRIGYRNQLFIIWKFRTMYQERTDLCGAQLTEHNDPRVTPVGVWLRKWSIDELPHLRECDYDLYDGLTMQPQQVGQETAWLLALGKGG